MCEECKECKKQAEQITRAITCVKVELKRLGVSIENDFYYGLMVESYTRWNANGQLQDLIRVFDDYESVVYYASDFLKLLFQLERSSLEPSSDNYIWKQISNEF